MVLMTCNCQFRHMFLMYPNLLREHSHLLFSSFLTLIHRSIYIHTHTLPPVSLSILIVVLFLQSPLSTVLPPVSFVCVKKKNPSLQSAYSIVHFLTLQFQIQSLATEPSNTHRFFSSERALPSVVHISLSHHRSATLPQSINTT